MNFDLPLNEIFIALPAVQFVVSVFLAILVIFSDPRSRLNRVFAAFLLAMAAWGITIFGMRDAFPNAEGPSQGGRAALVGGTGESEKDREGTDFEGGTWARSRVSGAGGGGLLIEAHLAVPRAGLHHDWCAPG